jgi:hypothetical protein
MASILGLEVVSMCDTHIFLSPVNPSNYPKGVPFKIVTGTPPTIPDYQKK